MTKFKEEWLQKRRQVITKAENRLKKEVEDLFPVGTVFNSHDPWSKSKYLTGKFKVVEYKIKTHMSTHFLGNIILILRRIDRLGRFHGKPEEYFLGHILDCITDVIVEQSSSCKMEK